MQQHEEKDYTQRFSLSLWINILKRVPEYRKDLIRICIVMAVTAVCDVLFPLMTSYAIDTFIPTGDRPPRLETLPWFIVAYIVLVVVEVVFIYRFLYLGGRVEVGVSYAIRK